MEPEAGLPRLVLEKLHHLWMGLKTGKLPMKSKAHKAAASAAHRMLMAHPSTPITIDGVPGPVLSHELAVSLLSPWPAKKKKEKKEMLAIEFKPHADSPMGRGHPLSFSSHAENLVREHVRRSMRKRVKAQRFVPEVVAEIRKEAAADARQLALVKRRQEILQAHRGGNPLRSSHHEQQQSQHRATVPSSGRLFSLASVAAVHEPSRTKRLIEFAREEGKDHQQHKKAKRQEEDRVTTTVHRRTLFFLPQAEKEKFLDLQSKSKHKLVAVVHEVERHHRPSEPGRAFAAPLTFGVSRPAFSGKSLFLGGALSPPPASVSAVKNQKVGEEVVAKRKNKSGAGRPRKTEEEKAKTKALYKLKKAEKRKAKGEKEVKKTIKEMKAIEKKKPTQLARRFSKKEMDRLTKKGLREPSKAGMKGVSAKDKETYAEALALQDDMTIGEARKKLGIDKKKKTIAKKIKKAVKKVAKKAAKKKAEKYVPRQSKRLKAK